MKAFVTSQFQYCPLVWVFHSRKMNSKINRLHEWALRIAYKDYTSTSIALLEKDKSVTLLEKILQLLMIKMFKTANNSNPSFIDEIVPQRSIIYNLRNTNTFSLPMIHTVNHGIEAIRYRGQRIWHSLPQEIKNSNSVEQLKNKIKSWSNRRLRLQTLQAIHVSTRLFIVWRYSICIFYELCNFIDLFYLRIL